MNTIPKPILLTAALVCALAATTTPLVALDATNSVETTKSTEPPEPPPYRPWTVGVGIGTDTIFGGGVSWRFSDHFGARTGFGYTESSWDDVGIRGLKYNVTARLMAEPLTLDIYPWQKSSFRVSVGMLFNQHELTGTVSSDGTINIGGEPVEIRKGDVSMKMKQQPVNPYLSIGGNFFYFDRAHHWAFAGELGIAYTGDVNVTLDRPGTSTISDDVRKEIKNRLQDYGDQFQWWPVAKLAVTYSF
jgi:hypothetical protein